MTKSPTTKQQTPRNPTGFSWPSSLGKPLFLLCTVLATALLAGFITIVCLGTLGFFGQTSPQTPAQLGNLLGSTVVTSLLALIFTLLIGLLAALYLSEFATVRTRGWLEEPLRFLAHVPPIVYGYFSIATFLPALATVVPALREHPNLEAGIALACMLVPGFLARSHSVLREVPQQLREGAWALGAGKFATAWFVVIPAARSHLFGALLQAAARAVGETMIVLVVFTTYASRQTNRPDTLTTFVIPNQTTLLREFDGLRATFIVAAALLVLALLLDAARLRLERQTRGDLR